MMALNLGPFLHRTACTSWLYIHVHVRVRHPQNTEVTLRTSFTITHFFFNTACEMLGIQNVRSGPSHVLHSTGDAEEPLLYHLIDVHVYLWCHATVALCTYWVVGVRVHVPVHVHPKDSHVNSPSFIQVC